MHPGPKTRRRRLTGRRPSRRGRRPRRSRPSGPSPATSRLTARPVGWAMLCQSEPRPRTIDIPPTSAPSICTAVAPAPESQQTSTTTESGTPPTAYRVGADHRHTPRSRERPTPQTASDDVQHDQPIRRHRSTTQCPPQHHPGPTRRRRSPPDRHRTRRTKKAPTITALPMRVPPASPLARPTAKRAAPGTTLNGSTRPSLNLTHYIPTHDLATDPTFPACRSMPSAPTKATTRTQGHTPGFRRRQQPPDKPRQRPEQRRQGPSIGWRRARTLRSPTRGEAPIIENGLTQHRTDRTPTRRRWRSRCRRSCHRGSTPTRR